MCYLFWCKNTKIKLKAMHSRKRDSILGANKLIFNPMNSRKRGATPAISAGIGLAVAGPSERPEMHPEIAIPLPVSTVPPPMAAIAVEPKSLVRNEPQVFSSTIQMAYEEAFQSQSSKGLESSASWLQLIETLSQGKKHRRKLLESTSLVDTDKEIALLCLRNLLDVQLKLSAISVQTRDVEELIFIQETLGELKELQQILAKRELSFVIGAKALPEFAITHLILGALTLNIAKLQEKCASTLTETIREAKATSEFRNPLFHSKAKAATHNQPLATKLAEAAYDCLEHQGATVSWINSLKSSDWINEALNMGEGKGDREKANALLEFIIQHTEHLRKTRQEPIEIQLLLVGAYLIAGAAITFFMKYQAANPFAPENINSASKSLDFFLPLHPVVVASITPNITASMSYTSSATFSPSETTTASSSELPSPSLSSSTTESASASTTPSSSAITTPNPSPSNSATKSVTETITSSVRATTTSSETSSPSPSSSITKSSSETVTPSASGTATSSETSSASPTETSSISSSLSRSATKSATETTTPSTSTTRTSSPTSSASPTQTGSSSQSPSKSGTKSLSETVTASISVSITSSTTPSQKVSATPTICPLWLSGIGACDARYNYHRLEVAEEKSPDSTQGPSPSGVALSSYAQTKYAGYTALPSVSPVLRPTPGRSHNAIYNTAEADFRSTSFLMNSSLIAGLGVTALVCLLGMLLLRFTKGRSHHQHNPRSATLFATNAASSFENSNQVELN